MGVEIVVDLELDCRIFNDNCILFDLLKLGIEEILFINLVNVIVNVIEENYYCYLERRFGSIVCNKEFVKKFVIENNSFFSFGILV